MKLLLLTGGSRGLGKALLEKYVDQGYNSVEFSRTGESKYNVKCDLSLIDEFSDIFSKTLKAYSSKKYSEIILINNAGTIGPIGPAAEFKPEDWIRHLNINFTASIITSGIFNKAFQNNACRKTIVLISSGAALRSKYGWSLYCASKAGLEQFGRTLALEQEKQQHPVKNIVIDPGIIDTGMQTEIRNADEKLFPELSRFKEFGKNGFLKNPEYVAGKIYSIITNNPVNGQRYIIE